MLKDAPIRSLGRVHMLEAVERLPGGKYRCICDCGNERIVNVGHFNAGNAKSCGCHRWHGHTGSRTYQSWRNMRARCHNKNNKRYPDYGGNGILVCDRWRNSFVAFLADMGECPDGYTIDREDNTKGYSPDNCDWVSRSTNQANRNVSRRWYVHGTEFPTAHAAAVAFAVSEQTIRAWCLGREAEGNWYPPRDGCSARQLYVDGRKAA